MAEDPIALVSFDSLGDSLIYVMMADNLQLNGFDVTLFGRVAHQLREWVPHLKVQPYPPEADFAHAFDHFRLVLMSPPRFLRETLTGDALAAARDKWVLLCQKVPPDWYADHRERLRAALPEERYAAFDALAASGGSIRFRSFSTESVVDITLEYMQKRMGLREVRRNVPLSPPEGLRRGRHARRIIVSPDSAGPEKKEWSPSRFIRLCHALRRRGYEPQIIVAPPNHARWRAMKGNVFETPRFDTIDALAAHVFESGALIANDSGNGHLASFLGVPVITIYRKPNEKFHWRPAWGPSRVVCPKICLPGIRDSIWRPFITCGQIIAELETLLERERNITSV
ncbi:MAG: glycosyltransferase family 9 protein [Aromatoleum sp.]|uniref:glycosyltransferase family 9 protein n=1 Tax=Aromatoleum sp. TaxID=2307007 RepID=UPI002893F8ED|nr:glycosyltransferase family 9 protein [Aromatoleum sp.]MDT3670434.1 glycosyltransferase family 9 protein [Aromatoleum sp.]